MTFDGIAGGAIGGGITALIALISSWKSDRDKTMREEAAQSEKSSTLSGKIDALESRVPLMIEVALSKSQERLVDKLQNGLGQSIVKGVSEQISNLERNLPSMISAAVAAHQEKTMEFVERMHRGRHE